MWYNMPFNIEFIKFIQSFSNPFFDKLFQGITMMGEEYFFVIILAIIFWCIDKKLGYRVGITILFGFVLNEILKNIFAVPRPFFQDGIRSLRIETATGYSFPSGHTQGVTTFWGILMLSLKKKWVYITGIILIMLVGLSRIYLGVHRPIDVIGAIVIGFAWVVLFYFLFEYSEKKGSYILLIICIPIIIGLFFMHSTDYYKYAGIIMGFICGYFIESQYIEFEVKTTRLKKILRFVVGIAGILLIRIGLKMVLPSALISDCARYLFIGVWATIGAPYIFKKFI